MDYRSVYTLGVDDKPGPLHIGLYPDYETRKDILAYLRSTGLTGWPHNSTSLAYLHCSILYCGYLRLPHDFDKEQSLNNPIDASGFKRAVRPLPVNGTAKNGTAIAILLPGVKRIKVLSDLLHQKFKISPVPPHYIFHVTLSRIQLFPPKSKQYEMTKLKTISDYYRLPLYEGKMAFNELKVSFDNR